MAKRRPSLFPRVPVPLSRTCEQSVNIGRGDSNSGPPPKALPGSGCVGRLTCGSLLPVLTRWCPLHSAACRLGVCPTCTVAGRSVDGAGMLRAEMAHRAPDERSGLAGCRACLGPHQPLDDPPVAQALDLQAVAHDVPQPQQVLLGGSGEVSGAEGHRPGFGDKGCWSCRWGGRGCHVASVVLLSACWAHPVPGSVRMPTRTIGFNSHRAIACMVSPSCRAFWSQTAMSPASLQ
jgi:hypothetical protein